ncbi:hypothetical protein JMM63_01430 [Rhodovulum sulfidophilum]|uniref:hypothetical protein n=1 Tax=Rhodovulum sulfidophilum TaxID=35806 RepID=UPI0019248E0F|nr:hypothetical protein [Rhodovulum sulfidophilum]MBL3594252.1 hypothetical protein [Rhodovulum sulfidophilum]
MRYAGADLPLFLTHGPVRLAITGRTLSGGSAAGVAMGEAFSPPLTIFALLPLAASAIFLTMGMLLNRQAGHDTAAGRRLTRQPPTRGLFRLHGGASAPTAFPFHMGILFPASSSSAALGTSTSPSSWRSGPLRPVPATWLSRVSSIGYGVADLAPRVATDQSPPERDADRGGADHSPRMTPNLVAAA